MTIKQAADDLRRMANAQGGSRLLLWAADTLEEMAKALAKTDYATTECASCKHRALMDSCTKVERYDFDCSKCKRPCRCYKCTGGSEWEWRGENDKES